jgi:hypothetical protein
VTQSAPVEVDAIGAFLPPAADVSALLEVLRDAFEQVTIKPGTATSPPVLTCCEPAAPLPRRALVRYAKLLYGAGATQVVALGDTEYVVPRVLDGGQPDEPAA